tara:strand:- start:450 stop:650 length:201 start_codon:yes stop_codon:yes gene_type:complete
MSKIKTLLDENQDEDDNRYSDEEYHVSKYRGFETSPPDKLFIDFLDYLTGGKARPTKKSTDETGNL